MILTGSLYKDRVLRLKLRLSSHWTNQYSELGERLPEEVEPLKAGSECCLEPPVAEDLDRALVGF